MADLDAAIDFYTRTFGMRCVHTETNTEQGVREAMLAVGPTTEGGCLQLLAPLTPESTIAKFLDRNGPGVQQVAYTVTDVDAACAALRDRGLRLLYDTPGEAPRARGSTSSTPRTPAASWSNSSNPPPTPPPPDPHPRGSSPPTPSDPPTSAARASGRGQFHSDRQAAQTEGRATQADAGKIALDPGSSGLTPHSSHSIPDRVATTPTRRRIHRRA